RSKWQTDEHPGVYRHASTGAGLRNGRVKASLCRFSQFVSLARETLDSLLEEMRLKIIVAVHFSR
ncbi:MAG TPA: hypothetical protein VGV15_21745, partial [Terriglobales bacterium]|nr:hypothetical protein [Terriglobales bacterium]